MNTNKSGTAASLLRVKDVAATCAISVTTVWTRVRTGTFPKPFKLGPRTTVWDAADVRAWQEAQRLAFASSVQRGGGHEA